jgi:pyruvate-formate lyase-activating enzyme
MMAKAWDEYKVRKLTKHDYKLINKAVDMISNDKIEFRFRDELKWSLIAILDEIESLDDIIDREHVATQFDKYFTKEDKKVIAIAPPEKIKHLAPCTQIEKDNTFKLMP